MKNGTLDVISKWYNVALKCVPLGNIWLLTLELPHGSILTHRAVCVIISSDSQEITLRHFMTFSKTWTYTSTKNRKNVVALLLEIIGSRPTPYNYRMGKKWPIYQINVVLNNFQSNWHISTDMTCHNKKKYPMLHLDTYRPSLTSLRPRWDLFLAVQDLS